MDNNQFSVPVPKPSNSVENTSSPSNVKYAGFWIRWVALMVDIIIITPLIVIAGIVMGIAFFAGGSSVSPEAQQIFGAIVNLSITYLYFSLMTYYKGATLGKMLVGIKVESDDFQKLSFGAVLMREVVGKFISSIIFSIGYIIAAFTAKKQALHDMIAHSVVVYKDPTNKNKTGLIIAIIIACIIPLLLAVAMMGIFSSIALVSLNSAREKGTDAQTQSSIMMIRTNAEVFYSNNSNSYSIARDCNSGVFAEKNIQAILLDMKNKDVTCYAQGSSYAVSAPLTSMGQSWCVDNTGFSGSGVAIEENSVASCRRNTSL